MAVIVVPWTPGSSQPTSSFSYPNRVSLAVADDGGGGSIAINGLGVTGGGFADLKTVFTANGALFNSIPLLRAFRLLSVNTDYAAQAQLVNEVEVVMFPISTAGVVPGISRLAGLGGNNFVPFLVINGPGAAATWRVDISLRHSIEG